MGDMARRGSLPAYPASGTAALQYKGLNRGQWLTYYAPIDRMLTVFGYLAPSVSRHVFLLWQEWHRAWVLSRSYFAPPCASGVIWSLSVASTTSPRWSQERHRGSIPSRSLDTRSQRLSYILCPCASHHRLALTAGRCLARSRCRYVSGLLGIASDHSTLASLRVVSAYRSQYIHHIP